MHRGSENRISLSVQSPDSPRRISSFNSTSPVNDSGFKNHVFGQQCFAGFGRTQQDNVFNVFFIVNFHVRIVLVVTWNASAGAKNHLSVHVRSIS
jgi:hypothetical protein